MSYNYLAIDFTGSLQELQNNFDKKSWNFEIKRVSTGRILAKVPEDTTEEVKFFESNEDGEATMTKVINITEEEYLTTDENGFELINPIINDEIKQAKNSLMEQLIETRKREEKPKNEVKFPEIPTPSTLFSGEDKISEALSDTVLPSKSPLNADDPFAYLTSRSYLRTFVIAASIVLCILTVFD
jgi:hypothetical protein